MEHICDSQESQPQLNQNNKQTVKHRKIGVFKMFDKWIQPLHLQILSGGMQI